MSKQTREVKDTEMEVLDVDFDEETETDKIEGDDTFIVPPVEDTDETETEDEKETAEEPAKEVTADSSPEEQSEPTQEPDAPSQKEPAPVEGETPAQKALRLEVQRLREKLREKRATELSGLATPPAAVVATESQDADDYSPEEWARITNRLKKAGFVSQEELYKKQVDDITNDFVKTHSEYLDSEGDSRWNRFKEIAESGIYDFRGKTPQQIKIIHEKIHKDVLEELGEPETTVEVRKQAAQQQKIRSVSHSGGTKTAVAKQETVTIDPSIRKIFKGFSDEDLA